MKTKLFLIFSLLFNNVSSSQEVGVIASKIWTDNKELQNSIGFGAYLSKDISKFFTIRLSYEYLSNKRIYNGYISTGIIGHNAVWEQIQSTSHANLWKLQLVVFPIRFESVSFGVGSTISNNFFSLDKKGFQTGKSSSSHDSQKFGIGYSFYVQSSPIQSVPIVVTINASRDFLGYSAIATESDNSFAQPMNTVILQIGLGYTFK